MDIFEAARSDDRAVVEDLLRGDGNLVDEMNDVGLTGLQICATYGSVNAMLVFLRFGANLHIRDRESGWTALHRAVYFGHVRAALLLIKSGARMTGGVLPNIYPWDHERLSPMDLLTTMYEGDLQEARRAVKSSCVVAFGKADFTLGVPLPKASDVVQPKRLEALSEECIVQVITNKHHSLAVTADGACYSWGHGRGGRLGHGNEASYPEPQRIAVFGGAMRPCVVRVASGENHTVAVTADGDIYSWGSDRFGQLGHGASAAASAATAGAGSLCLEPRRIEALRREFVVAVAAGDAHTLCATTGNDVYAWGGNKSGQLGLKRTEVTSLAGGVPGSALPKRIFIEGVSAAVQQPGGKASKSAFLKNTTTTPGLTRILQVCASYNNSLLVCRRLARPGSSASTEMYQWGHGIASPLRVVFDGADRKRSASQGEQDFTIVGAGRPVHITAVAAGQHHYVAMSNDGCVYTWGAGFAQLGHGVQSPPPPASIAERVSEEGHLSTPRIVAGLIPEGGRARVVAVAATSNRCCAVTARGELFSWGAAEKQGVLTSGPSNYEPVPSAVAGIRRAVSVSAGPDHTIVLTANTLPALPLSAHPMYAHCCKQTGQPMDEATMDELAASTEAVAVEEEQPEQEEAAAAEGSAAEYNPDDEVERIDCVDGSEGEGVEDTGVPSLFALCQRQLARIVTAKTAVAALMCAEQVGASLLEDYCTTYLQRNLDAVLLATSKTDLDGFTASMGLSDAVGNSGSYGGAYSHPKAVGASPGVTARKASTSAVAQAPGPLLRSRGATSLRAPLGDDQIEEEPKKLSAEDVRKQIKAVKKKLASIEELKLKISEGEAQSGQPAVLSQDQKEKLARRPALCAELAHLEQLLVRSEHRERRAGGAQPPAPSGLEPDVALNTGAAAVAVTKSKVLEGKSKPSENFSSPPIVASVPTPATAAVDLKKPPTPSSAKKGKRVKGISLEEFYRTGGQAVDPAAAKKSVPTTPDSRGNPWKVASAVTSGSAVDDDYPTVSSATPTGRTVLSPPAPSPVLAPAPLQAAAAPAKVPAVPSSSQSARPAAVSRLSALPSGGSQSAKSSAPASPFTTPSKPINGPGIADLSAGSLPRTRNLLDFLPSKKGATVAEPVAISKPGWTASPPVTSTQSAVKLSLSDIQRAEEEARRASNMEKLAGNSNPWYVERRPRAESLGEVARQQQREKEEAEEVHRALMAVQAAQAQERTEKLAAKANAKKKSNNKSGGGDGGKDRTGPAKDKAPKAKPPTKSPGRPSDARQVAAPVK